VTNAADRIAGHSAEYQATMGGGMPGMQQRLVYGGDAAVQQAVTDGWLQRSSKYQAILEQQGSITAEEAEGWFWDDDKVDHLKLRAMMERAGIEDLTLSSMRRFWSEAVDMASEAFTAGGKKVSPWDMAEILSQDLAELREGEEEQYQGPVTTTSESTNIPDADTVHGLIRDTFRNLTGRAPDETETEQLGAALLAHARSNPSVTTQTSTPGPEGAPSQGGVQSTVSQGGIDPGEFIEQQVRTDFAEEEQQYRVATKYASVLDALMGGQANVGGEVGV